MEGKNGAMHRMGNVKEPVTAATENEGTKSCFESLSLLVGLRKSRRRLRGKVGRINRPELPSEDVA